MHSIRVVELTKNSRWQTETPRLVPVVVESGARREVMPVARLLVFPFFERNLRSLAS